MKKFNHLTIPALKIPVMIIAIMLLLSPVLFAQEVSYKDNWGNQGLTLKSQSPAGVTINFSVQSINLADVNIGGVNMKAVTMPGVFLPNDAGMPDLAGTGRYIAIPTGSKVTYRIISSRKEVISNIDIAPAPVLPLDNDKRPLVYKKNMQVYERNSPYPESPVNLSPITQIRGVDAVLVGITPFQYNPVTKELTVYKDLQVQIDFIGGNGQFGDPAFRSRWWEPILSDALLNYTTLPVINFDRMYKDIMLENGYEYVIIVPNNPEFSAWADTVKRFRSAQGIKTGIYKLSDIGGNTVEGIKAWVTNAYNTWTVKPSAICLMADFGTDAAGASTIIAKLQPDSGYPDFASDNYYADVNGDEMPEIVFSRIIANNATELQTLITKNLNYEKNPPTSAYYYSHPITALGWQTERWFQLCSEVVGGYFKKVQGKFPTRINKVYSGAPGTQWSTATNTAAVVSYFGPAGRYYIPQTPDSLGGFDGGTPTQVVNAINQGAFLLQHRDHGEYIGWGEPGFNTSYASQLNNTDLTFIYSINCETGAYHNPSGCPANGSFVEVFYRYKYNGQNSGALGMVCPSEVSYSFVNDAYLWGNYDNMWPNFLPDYGTTPPSRDVKPAFGMAAGKYFLQQSSWPYNTGNKLVTYRLFHMHGDAFLNLYSEVPQNLTVNHASSIIGAITSFTVTANAGAFIALSVNGNILGTGTGTGSPSSIAISGAQLPGQIMNVVITKQNYNRYTSNVNVIPASGPYIVQDSCAIFDDAPFGNGNKLMDYGETNKLTLRVKNVGSVTANNVSVNISTTDSYITLTDSTENYGSIPANTTASVTNGFAYNVANNIPDNRQVNFTVTATNGTDIWTSSFSLTAHAPIMGMGGYAITDSTGNNNGRLDPGETAALKLYIKNTGTSQLKNAIGRLSSTCSYLTFPVDSVVYGNINGLDSLRKQFTVVAAPNTPIGTLATIKCTMRATGGFLCVDSFQVTVGQNVAVIGNGTTACAWPFYTYYMDSRTDMLYTFSEILSTGGFAGHVTKIGFDVTTAVSQVMNGFTIKMQTTTATSLSGFTSTGWTTVYTGPYTVAGTGWQYINLQIPFYWNGTTNLLVEICFDNSSYTTNTIINGTPNSLNQVKHNHSDLPSGNGCTDITTPSTSYTARPNTSLTFNIINNLTGNENGIPKSFSLSQNFPNPFNPSTKISYAVPKQSLVILKVFDVLGREVRTLVNDVKTPGYYMVDFNASDLSSGVYYFRLEAGNFVETKKLMLIK